VFDHKLRRGSWRENIPRELQRRSSVRCISAKGRAEERTIGQERQEPEAGDCDRPFGSAQGREKSTREKVSEEIRKKVSQNKEDKEGDLITTKRGTNPATCIF
jgi:hypothetical protein